jgi:iron complex transport system substrate-binding protein
MVKRNNIFSFFIFILFFTACDSTIQKKNDFEANEKKLSYAKCFKIFEFKDYKLIQILNQQQLIGNYILYKDKQPKTALNNVTFIKTPLNKIAALSSIYIGFLNRLNQLDKIYAIDNADYVFNRIVNNNVKQSKIKEIALNGQLNQELAIQLKPDIVFTYFTPNDGVSNKTKLIQAGIPLVSLVDHFENHPLGRAEWIKFFGCFFNQEKLADSLFSATEQNYNSLKQLALKSKNMPKVLTEHKLSDAWYVPGGKSYMAALLNDANADYFWKTDKNSGSLPLSFEEVYSKAVGADYWLNVLFCKTKTDLKKLDSRYTNFKAFQINQVFNNDKMVTENGANDYWESGLTQPDLILNDLIVILHPELNLKNQLQFYQKLK